MVSQEKAEKPDYENINAGGGNSEPSDTDLYNRIKREAKEKFDVYPSAVANAWVVREYKKRGGGYRKETAKMILKEDGFVPPKGAQENARRGLELREKFKRGGTMVGVARARDLSNGKSLPLKTINRMVSYFARHEVDKKGKDWGNASNPSRGYIAWLLWGGDAGKTWADSIAEREKKKDKSMTTDLAHSYAAIIKQEKQDDGTLLVYGKATDDALDIDQQICDAGWLDRAMPEWFKTGGNIREQHSNIAAGVAKELDSKADGHYISALVVDPVSIKKVEAGVLKGFSIGIRAPRIVRDTKAANGRIIDGQIVEISLVDRPANPNAKLMLAKSDTAGALEQVEEFIEKEQERDEAGRFGSGSGSGGSDKPSSNKPESGKPEAGYNSLDQEAISSAIDVNDDVSQMMDSVFDEDSDDYDENTTEKDEDAVEAAEDSLKEANEQLDRAYNAKDDDERKDALENAMVRMEEAQTILANADSKSISSIANDERFQESIDEVETMLDVYNERDSKSVTTTTTKERAMARKKTVTKSMHEEEEKAVAEKPSKEDLMKQYEECKMNYMAAQKALDECKSMCKEAGVELEEDEEKEYGESAEEETAEGSKPEAAEEEVEEAEGKKPLDKSDTAKCLECGCDKPSDAHGRDDVSTATMVSPTETPKSSTTILPRIDVDGNDIADNGIDEDSSDDEDLSNKTITAIIEKAVKSAKDAITNEVISYQEEINKLNAELATAKTKAVAGGPKRSVIKPAVIAELGDLLQKAAEYRAKSAVTDDKDLARGYKELASDFEAKALVIQANK